MKISCTSCSFTFEVDAPSEDELPCPACGSMCSSTLSVVARPELGHTDETVVERPNRVDSETASMFAGRYEIVRQVGKGGFGKVFLARDHVLERVVALKVPRASAFENEKVRNQFLDEARIAARLSHPGIVTILDAAASDDECFIAMEFVEDESLLQAMRSRSFSIEEAVTLVENVARALHHAHTRGLVHRDMKPSNILLGKDGAPRVTDFGLAVTEISQWQLTGEIAGTPSYMPPEQVRGETHRLDGRADIWSTGVILYELLTGRRPFAAPDDRIFEEIISRAPRPLRQINDSIPLAVEDICLKCLSKSPTGRYATALDLANALAESRVSAAPPQNRESTVSQAPTGGNRNLMAITGIVIAVAALLLALRPKDTNPNAIKGGDQTLLLRADISALVPAEPEFKPGRWHDLIVREPTVLYWLPYQETSRWNFAEDRQELNVDSDEIAMFGLGSTKARWYRLQTGIQKNSWSGFVGLFWGYEKGQHESGYPSAKCNAIVIRADGKNESYAQRSIYEIVYHPRTPLHNYEVVSPRVNVELAGSAQSILELEIVGNSLNSVRWNGVEVEELTGKFKDRKIKSVPPVGTFGIINYDGASNFRDARIRINDTKEGQD